MSNEGLKVVFQKLLNLQGKNGKPGHILCLDNKLKHDTTSEESKINIKQAKFVLKAYKKPLYVVGGKKRKRVFNTEAEKEEYELEKKRSKYLANKVHEGINNLFKQIIVVQKEFNSKMNEAGNSETKKEKVIASTSKSNFIDRLKSKPAKKTITIEATL